MALVFPGGLGSPGLLKHNKAMRSEMISSESMESILEGSALMSTDGCSPCGSTGTRSRMLSSEDMAAILAIKPAPGVVRGINAVREDQTKETNSLVLHRFAKSFTRITRKLRSRKIDEVNCNLSIAANNELVLLKRTMMLSDSGLPGWLLDFDTMMSNDEIEMKLVKIHAAILKIQKAWRKAVIKKAWWRNPDESYVKDRAAICIQRHWRGTWVRLRARREREAELRNQAAVTIQRHVRGFLYRKCGFDPNRRSDAATVIQAAWRGWMGRRLLRQLKSLVEPTVEQLWDEVGEWLITYCYDMGANIASGRSTTGRFMKPLWMGKGFGTPKFRRGNTIVGAPQNVFSTGGQDAQVWETDAPEPAPAPAMLRSTSLGPAPKRLLSMNADAAGLPPVRVSSSVGSRHVTSLVSRSFVPGGAALFVAVPSFNASVLVVSADEQQQRRGAPSTPSKSPLSRRSFLRMGSIVEGAPKAAAAAAEEEDGEEARAGRLRDRSSGSPSPPAISGASGGGGSESAGCVSAPPVSLGAAAPPEPKGTAPNAVRVLSVENLREKKGDEGPPPGDALVGAGAADASAGGAMALPPLCVPQGAHGRVEGVDKARGSPWWESPRSSDPVSPVSFGVVVRVLGDEAPPSPLQQRTSREYLEGAGSTPPPLGEDSFAAAPPPHAVVAAPPHRSPGATKPRPPPRVPVLALPEAKPAAAPQSLSRSLASGRVRRADHRLPALAPLTARASTRPSESLPEASLTAREAAGLRRGSEDGGRHLGFGATSFDSYMRVSSDLSISRRLSQGVVPPRTASVHSLRGPAPVPPKTTGSILKPSPPSHPPDGGGGGGDGGGEPPLRGMDAPGPEDERARMSSGRAAAARGRSRAGAPGGAAQVLRLEPAAPGHTAYLTLTPLERRASMPVGPAGGKPGAGVPDFPTLADRGMGLIAGKRMV